MKVFQEDKYVLFKVHKNITLKMVMNMAAEHLVLAKEGIINNLTDARGIKCIMDTAEIYDYAYTNTTNLQIPHDLSLAILKDEDDDSHNFIETVGRNAGYKVKLFHEEAEALDWFKSR